MQYIYYLNYAIPSRGVIKVDDPELDSNKAIIVLEHHNLRESDTAYMITDKELELDEHPGVITKIDLK